MKAKYYSDENIFKSELDAIYLSSSYIGDLSLLENENDYYSFELMGKYLTARNIDGELNLYSNNCQHRLNLIDPIGFGNRIFSCSYHGWAYNVDGQVKRTPLIDNGNVICHRLKKSSISISQGAMFAGRDSIATAQTFSNLFERFNFKLGNNFHESEMLHEANWKLLVENVLEGYHISFVHGESFVPQGITSTSNVSAEYFGKSSFMKIYSKKEQSNRTKFIPDAVNTYLHAFIYPNMFVAITGGLVGFVGKLIPISPTKTILNWKLYESPILSAQKEGIKNFIQEDAIKFGTKLLNEDRSILEQQQKSLNSLNDEAMNYNLENESRIVHFVEKYLKDMNL